MQVDLAGHVDLGEVWLIRDWRKGETVARWIGHDASHCQQLRHIRASLFRQLQAEKVGRLAGLTIALDGARHGKLAAVVGGNGEEPIPIEFRREEL